MSPIDREHQDLVAELDQLAAKARRHMRLCSLRAGLRSAVGQGPALLLAGSMLLLLIRIVEAVIRTEIWPLDFLLILLPPIIYIGMRFAGIYFTASVSRPLALALYDRQLGLKDRLGAADEFIAQPTRLSNDKSGFRAAAIGDAEHYVGQAQAVDLKRVRGAVQKTVQHPLFYLLPALFLGLLSLVVDDLLDPHSMRSDVALPAVSSSTGELEYALTEEQRRSKTREQGPRQLVAGGDTRGDAPDVSLRMARLEGDGKTAQSAPGQSRNSKSNGASSSTSTSSSSKLSTEEEKKGFAAAVKKALEEPSLNETPQPERLDTGESGSSKDLISGAPGQGKSGLSGQDPGGSDGGKRSSPADKSTPDKSDSAKKADEALSELFSSSSEPQLRIRRAPPPVPPQTVGAIEEIKLRQNNSQNPGNGRNRSAQNRGPRGQETARQGFKKSRGVAAMILGVPLPDRIKGISNEGREKSKQDQIEPEEEQVGQVEAQNRPARDRALGHIEHPVLSAFEKALVRDYFVGLNDQARDKTGEETGHRP